MALNWKPSYHLCVTSTIPPPPNGHLDLGSILTGLDSDGVDHPLNIYSKIPVPEDHIYPRNGPDEKQGFARTLGELRKAEAGLWATIFGVGRVNLGFMRERSDDETLTVEKLLTRYFSPSKEYMDASLEKTEVVAYVEDTEKKMPLYMVTGYMWVEGAKLSRAKSGTTQVRGELSVQDPHNGSGGGMKARYTGEGLASTGFDSSSPFILGLRVRKIWWNEQSKRQTSDRVAGVTLDDDAPVKENMLTGLEYEDNASAEGERVDITEDVLGIGPSVWVLPART